MNATKILALATMSALALAGCRKGESPAAAHSDPEAPRTAAKRERAMWHCPMHPTVIREEPGKCPLCGMDLVPFVEPPASGTDAADADAPVVSLDPATVQKTGVETESVSKRRLDQGVRASGRVAADESRWASVPLRTMGYVEELLADRAGIRVRKGQALAKVYSPDVVVAQEEFLRSSGVLREAARRRLENWDVDAALLRRLDAGEPASRTFSVISPVDGTVMEKTAVRGQAVMPGTEMFRILDLSRVWVVAQVPQSDVERVRAGDRATVSVIGIPGRSFEGTVSWTAPAMDAQTRTAAVRIEVPNTPDRLLRLDMVADVRIAPRGSGDEVIAVPQQALIPTGSRVVAIVALGGGRFQPREVRTGLAAGGYVQILSGLEEGDRIVTSAQFLLDSESNLRAALARMAGGAHDHGGSP